MLFSLSHKVGEAALYVQALAKERCSRLFSVFELPGHQGLTAWWFVCKMCGGVMGAHILIIDDTKSWLHTLVSILSHQKCYQVTAVESGREGLDLICKNPEKYNIVLLDLMLLDIGGLDILAVLQANPETQKIPVILQTGSEEIPNILEALKRGAVCCIRKPYTHRILFPLLEKILSGNKPEQQVYSLS